MANPKKVGLVIAALIGGWHVIWVALVAAGWAQPLINFVFLGAHDSADLQHQTV
jgi:hypothetical protein